MKVFLDNLDIKILLILLNFKEFYIRYLIIFLCT